MSPRDAASLRDIVEATRIVRSYVAGKTQDQFLADPILQDAVVRRLEIIGEAARGISPEGLREAPQLPWARMVAMRNRIIHGYDEVDLGIVWETVANDLPALATALEAALQTLAK